MNEKERYLKHIRAQIESDLKELATKKTALENLIRDLYSYDVNPSEFECPLGFSKLEALCPQCDKVLPRIQEMWVRAENGQVQIKIYPVGMSSEMIEKCKSNETGCIEWRRKSITAVCGCGGTATCVCGYSEDFCYPAQNSCPFCGRNLKIEYSKKWNDFVIPTITKKSSPPLYSIFKIDKVDSKGELHE